LVIGLLGIRLARISFFLLAGLNRKLETYWIYKVHYASGLSGLEETELFVCQALALVVWSWIAGYVLALLSRRTLWITGSVYFSFCALFMILLCSYPLWVHTAHNGIRRNAPLLMWATLFAQAVTLAVSFVVPSVLGMRRGLRNFTFSLGQTWVLAGAVLVVTGLAAWTGGWPGAAVVRWTGNAWDPRVGLASRLYFFGLVSWPVAYLVVDSLFRRMIVKSLQAKES
jgi:hypothetical protein